MNPGFSPDELDLFKRNFDAYVASTPKKTPVVNTPQPKKGAGRAGGLKGFALDVLPFGRVTEKLVNPNAGNITGGELLSEAILTALPLGLGKAGKVVKGVKAGKATKDAVSASGATKELTRTKKLANELTSRGSGFKVGPDVGGTSRLEDAADVYQRHAIIGTPKQQLKKIDSKVMPYLGKQVDDTLNRTDIPLSGKNVRASVQSAVNDPLKYAEIDLSLPGVQRNLDTHLKKFESAKSAREVNDYIKTLNPIAIRAQGKLVRGVALTDKEAAALAAKKAGDEVLAQIPEIAPLKRDMAILFDRYAETSSNVGKKSGIPIIGGVVSAPASLARYGESKIGQLLSGAGKSAASTPGMVGQVVKPLAQQAGVRIGADAFGLRDKGILPAEDPQAVAPPQEAVTQSPEAFFANMQGSSSDSSSPFAPQNLESAIQQILANGGNIDDASKFVGLAEAMQKIQAAGQQTTKPLSAEASKVIGNANSGLTSLDQFEAILNSDPSVQLKSVIPGRSLFGGAGASLLGTSSYDAAARNIADVITRLRTGAALTESEEKFYKSQLPQAFDPPETVQQKLKMFRDLFTSISTSTGTAGTDVQAAVASGNQ